MHHLHVDSSRQLMPRIPMWVCVYLCCVSGEFNNEWCTQCTMIETAATVPIESARRDVHWIHCVTH